MVLATEQDQFLTPFYRLTFLRNFVKNEKNRFFDFLLEPQSRPFSKGTQYRNSEGLEKVKKLDFAESR